MKLKNKEDYDSVFDYLEDQEYLEKEAKRTTKIIIVGAGYVGLSVGMFLAYQNNCEVTFLDKNRSVINGLRNYKIPIQDDMLQNILDLQNYNKLIHSYNVDNTEDNQYIQKAVCQADYICYCLPVPNNNLSLIQGYIDKFSNITDAVTVIHSTCTIEAFEKIRIKSSKKLLYVPEFLREGHGYEDLCNPARIVIGYDGTKDGFFAAKKYQYLHSVSKVFFTTYKEAISIKLFSNFYLATRITFFNQLQNYAAKKELDCRTVIDGICADHRIGSDYNRTSFGYGGYCLPKDTFALAEDIPLANYINLINEKRLEYIAMDFNHPYSVIGVYKVGAKENSDNCRDSATIKILNKILKHHLNAESKIVIYEPNVNHDNILKIMENTSEVTFVKTIKELKMQSTVILCDRYNCDDLDDYTGEIYTCDSYYKRKENV